MKNFYGTCRQAGNLMHVHAYLTENKLKPVGVPALLDTEKIIEGVRRRLSTAPLANQVDALFIATFECPDEHMSVGEWTMFVCGFATGEGLGQAMCFPFVDDFINPRFVSVFIVRLDGYGQRTPFHTIDKLPSTPKAGENLDQAMTSDL